jgi:hypothetical protein
MFTNFTKGKASGCLLQILARIQFKLGSFLLPSGGVHTLMPFEGNYIRNFGFLKTRYQLDKSNHNKCMPNIFAVAHSSNLFFDLYLLNLE